MKQVIKRLLSAAVIVITAPLMIMMFSIGIVLTTLFQIKHDYPTKEDSNHGKRY